MMQQNEEKLERKKSKGKKRKLTKQPERKTKNVDPRFMKEKCEKKSAYFVLCSKPSHCIFRTMD